MSEAINRVTTGRHEPRAVRVSTKKVRWFIRHYACTRDITRREFESAFELIVTMINQRLARRGLRWSPQTGEVVGRAKRNFGAAHFDKVLSDVIQASMECRCACYPES